MAIFTARISRGLSIVDGKPNRKPLGDVLQITPGILKMSATMEELFYPMPVDLTDSQVSTIKTNLDPIKYNGDGSITVDRTKSVALNSFSTAEKTLLAARVAIRDKLGGTPTFNNFVMT